MWYHFLDLNPDEKHQRRLSLDFYAEVAQLSVLVPLFYLQIYFLIVWARRKFFDSSFSNVRTKRDEGNKSLAVSKWRRWWRRLEWWAGGRVNESSKGGLGEQSLAWAFGEARRGEVVLGTVWGLWLVACCFLDTGHDYMHLTKRFGIVGASQLPFHYLLSLKSPYSPLQALTRQSWESLNILHQLLGQVITILFYLHAIFYLNYFIQVHVLAQRLGEKVVILGLTAIFAFTVIATTSLSWLRKLNYRLFYSVHVALATVLLPVLYFHVHHIRLYIWETLAVLVLNFLTRAMNTRLVSGTITFAPHTKDQLISITIPLPQLHNRWPKPLSAWEPGQHVYISTPASSSLLSLLPTRAKNPFTITSTSSSNTITLIARVHSGFTNTLACTVRAAATADKTAVIPMKIEGPYGLSTHSLALLSYDRVLFVAGGVGATFIVPLYRALLRDLSPSSGSRRREGVRFVWCVRDMAETGWAGRVDVPKGAEEEEGEIDYDGFWERISVFVTRGAESDTPSRVARTRTRLQRSIDDDDRDDGDDDDDGVEMEQLLPPEANHASGQDSNAAGSLIEKTKQGRADISITPGRPDLRALIDETFNATDTAAHFTAAASSTISRNSDSVPDPDSISRSQPNRVAVFVCGPKGLARDLRREVGRYAKQGRDVWFWNEEFGL